MVTPFARPIPASGELLPVVGLGTWQTFDVGRRPEERAPLENVLAGFVEAGGRLVDSSPMYGRAEEVAGDLAARLDLRQRLFVATKVWTTGRQEGIAQMEASMQKLRSPRIDLMQVHNLVDVRTHLETLRAWKGDGRVRYIGITHYTAGSHDAVADLLAREPVDFVQINYSALERNAEARILPTAIDRGIAVLANRPFMEGQLLRRLARRPLPAWAGEIGCESWAELLLKFVVSHPAVTCVIPATSDAAHLRANMRAAHGPLPGEEMRERIVREVGS